MKKEKCQCTLCTSSINEIIFIAKRGGMPKHKIKQIERKRFIEIFAISFYSFAFATIMEMIVYGTYNKHFWFWLWTFAVTNIMLTRMNDESWKDMFRKGIF